MRDSLNYTPVLHMAKVLVRIASITLTLTMVVNGGGKVSVQLIDYKNSASELYNGQCCDNLKLCIDDCDNYFNLCFTKPGSSSHCSLLDVKTAVLGDDSFRFTGDLSNGIRNPLVYSFSKWEGLVFNVKVWDSDNNADDLVDNYSFSIQHTPSSNKATARAHSHKICGRPSCMNIVVGVYCDNNFFIPDCVTLCLPRDDHTGHYTCDYTRGRKVCRHGWYGSACLNYCVPRDDEQGHYSCDSAGDIVCNAGWFGVNCTTHCVPRSDHQGHYNCSSGGEKLCDPDWYGEQCDVHCKPSNHGNSHYGCSEEGGIVCQSGWTGENCTVVITVALSFTTSPYLLDTSTVLYPSPSKSFAGVVTQRINVFSSVAIVSASQGPEYQSSERRTGGLLLRTVSPKTCSPSYQSQPTVISQTPALGLTVQTSWSTSHYLPIASADIPLISFASEVEEHLRSKTSGLQTTGLVTLPYTRTSVPIFSSSERFTSLPKGESPLGSKTTTFASTLKVKVTNSPSNCILVSHTSFISTKMPSETILLCSHAEENTISSTKQDFLTTIVIPATQSINKGADSVTIEFGKTDLESMDLENILEKLRAVLVSKLNEYCADINVKCPGNWSSLNHSLIVPTSVALDVVQSSEERFAVKVSVQLPLNVFLPARSLLEVLDSGKQQIENATETHILSINAVQPSLFPPTFLPSNPTVFLRPGVSSHAIIYVTAMISVVLILLLTIFGVRCIHQRHQRVRQIKVLQSPEEFVPDCLTADITFLLPKSPASSTGKDSPSREFVNVLHLHELQPPMEMTEIDI